MKPSFVYSTAFVLALAATPQGLQADAPAPIAATPSTPPAPMIDTPVLKVGTTTITESQLNKKFGPQLYDAESNLYRVKSGLATQYAHDIVFDQAAKTAGLSRAAWDKKEIDAKVTTPTPAEIDDIIKRMGGTTATDPAQQAQMRQQASSYLMQQKRQQAEQAAYTQLAGQSAVEVLIPKPVAPRVDIPFNAKLHPLKGPKDAPITIVEFTDFQCPWCKRSQPTLQQVEQTYPGKVRVIARSFPLPMHPRAEPAAEAAMCAKEQGKYWEYRDKLFDKQELSDADLSRYAKELGLKEKKFAECVSSHKYQAQVLSDIADGQKYGVSGTPTFFVNGMKVSFNELDDSVKSELATPKKS